MAQKNSDTYYNNMGSEAYPDEPDDILELGNATSVDFSSLPTVEELIYQLISDVDTPETTQLFALSDLNRQDAEFVRQNWPSIPVGRRRSVITLLNEQSRQVLELHLGRLLEVALHDSDPDVRLAAVQGLWEETDSTIMGLLIHLLRTDPAADVRSAAAGALGAYILAGELGELDSTMAMRAEEALLAILHNEKEPIDVQSHALEAIAYSGELGVRQLIEDAYYAPEEEMRVSALIAMGRSADIRWRNFARVELGNPSVAMRAQAAYTCGELEVKTASEELVRLLTDEEPTVRLAAIFALGRMGGKEAKDALGIMATSDDPDEVQAVDDALEDMLFYTETDPIPLFDETLEEVDEWELDPWETWREYSEHDFGSYG